MVVGTGRAPRRALTREYAAVLESCRQPRAVAEVAGRLRLPLGVVRVLLDDLIRAGLVAVAHGGAASVDLALVDRLIAGIQRMN